MTLRDVTTL